MIRIQSLRDSAKLVLDLAGDYKGQPHREMLLDGLLYGVLHSKYRIKRQYHVRRKNGRPKRIDFRQPGLNPVVIEFAVRTTQTGNEIYGSQNRSELHKLTRQNNAKARYLLLLDVAKRPLASDRLKRTYQSVRGPKGRGPRMSVQVIYAHRSADCHFLWQPKRRQ